MFNLNWPVFLGAVVLALQIGLRILALGVIPGGRKPSTGTAWLLVILIEPFLGFALFLLFGRTSLGRKRQERQRQAVAMIAEKTGTPDVPHPLEMIPADVRPEVGSIIHLNQRLGALPLIEANGGELLEDYQGAIARMAGAVDEAERFVNVEFYITSWDEVTDPLYSALARAADRGVEVRLLFDHLGTKGIPGYQDFLKRLEATKIEWHPMLPLQPLKGRWRRPDLRNHRKLLVIDGLVGFTGSLNLIEPGYNKPKNHKLGREWVELMIRLEGPVVEALGAVFAADWFTETTQIPPVRAIGPHTPGNLACQLVPSGPGYVMENNLRMFNSLIYSASRRISLTSPYFVPDESLLAAVTTAAQRGVAVELFVSESSDQFMVGHAQASYYRALLEAGVRIFQYPAPWILHSKHFTIDDHVAVIGSSNMDMRSFALNYEISLMMLGGDVVARMRQVEDHYRELSKELLLEDWAKRPRRLKFVDNVMRLTSALQ